ncbi:MAG: hypothetical protein HY288_06750 [Planctomycetia bacterium]|nr:hypothetical protein [Planctomycetia bacterium]
MSYAAESTKKSVADKKKIELPGPSDAPVVRIPHPQPRKPTDFKSTHFLVHTDLPSKEAHELLNRLEMMLGLISKYWGHPPVGIIECYVVKDLNVWPPGSLHPTGQAKIAQEAGVTLSESLTLGNKTVAAKAVVYAYADRGTPQHEAVHAYCSQTFGKTGPLWYSEGMAEMGQYWYHNDAGVHCHPFVVQYIRASQPKSLSSILSEQSITGDSWQNYAWRWALCHLLANNTNYAARFRPLGLGFLTGQRVSFAETYGPMAAEIAFEYRFFLRHLDEGYRVDLCSWDWKRKFKEPSGGAALTSRIVANRGWQASGVLVSPEKKYDYSASGMWQLSKTAEQATADGNADGAGRLEGVIFKDFELSEAFALGAFGSFTPPAEGQLFLRCRDEWNELADNKGVMSVKIKQAGDGQPLLRPTHTAEEPAETAAAE